MESQVAITDKMMYKVKPSAVRSDNYLHNIKASNGNSFEVKMGQILFLKFQLWVMGTIVTFLLLTLE